MDIPDLELTSTGQKQDCYLTSLLTHLSNPQSMQRVSFPLVIVNYY